MKRIFAVLVALFLFACGGSDDGGIQVNVRSSALSSADVASVVLNYQQTSGGSFTGSVTLTPASGVVGTTLTPLPAGNYSLTATAKNATNVAIYSGTATVTVPAGQTALVSMLLQQSTSNPQNNTFVPNITAFTFSPVNPVPNQSVTATVSAGGATSPITYQWTATCDSATSIVFSKPEAYSTTIVSDCSTSMLVTVSVTSGGLTSSATTTLSYGIQSAAVSIDFNAFPTISAWHATDGQVGVGGTVAISVDASDPDADPLTYTWSLPTTGYSCSGASLSASTTHSVVFTAPPELPRDGRCQVNLTVSDGRGGQITGYVQVMVSSLN